MGNVYCGVLGTGGRTVLHWSNLLRLTVSFKPQQWYP